MPQTAAWRGSGSRQRKNSRQVRVGLAVVRTLAQKASVPGAERISRGGLAIAVWGVLGVLALLGQAVLRLGEHALEPIIAGTLQPIHVAIYLAWVIFSLYTEGYRAFQKRWSPRVAARALHLGRNPRPLHVVFAPAYCMSLLHASQRGLAVAWATVLMIVCFVVALRFTPQPWRGIVDGGVVLALIWGAAAIVYFFARGIMDEDHSVDLELPERAGES